MEEETSNTCLQRLRSFNLDTRLLLIFYHSVVASLNFFAAVCWEGGIGNGGINKLNKLVRKVNTVVGLELNSMTVVTERRMGGKMNIIMDNLSHPL